MGLHLWEVTAVVETYRSSTGLLVASSTRTATINPAAKEQVVIAVQEKRHKKCMKKVIATILLLLLLMGVLGEVVFAIHFTPGHPAQAPIRIPNARNLSTPQGVVNVLLNIADWIFIIFLVIASIFIIFAALQFVTSGGNPDAASQARIKVIYSIVGITVAFLARGLHVLVANVLGV